MTLYTRKQGEFRPLTKQQLHKMQRFDHVIDLQRAAITASNTLLALAAWLEHMEKRGNRPSAKDFVISASPNRARIVGQVKSIATAIRVLQKGEGARGPA